MWLLHEIEPYLEQFLYGGTILILLLCGIGLPIPEEATFLVVGYVANKIHADVRLLCIAGVVGILLGDSIPFLLGKFYGIELIKRPFFARLMTEKRLHKTREFFEKHGSKTVFAARFIAGVRMPAFFIAATMGVPYRVFLCWNLLGALISCPTSIYLAYAFGPVAEEWLRQSKFVAIGALGGMVIIYLIIHFFWLHRERPDADELARLKAEKEASLIAQAEHKLDEAEAARAAVSGHPAGAPSAPPVPKIASNPAPRPDPS